jgi:hypothetical protein
MRFNFCQKTTPDGDALDIPGIDFILRITMMPPPNQKRLVALTLVLLGAVFLVVFFDKPQALPEVMMLAPGAFTMKDGRIPDRWIPAKWAWLQRACQRVFGVVVGDGFEPSKA